MFVKNILGLAFSASVAMSLAFANPAFADRRNPREAQARKGDVAKSYVLDDNGNFFRMVSVKKGRKTKEIKCQITDKVESFKVSKHSEDRAMAYYIRLDSWNNPALYSVANGKVNEGGCPEAKTGKLLDSIKWDTNDSAYAYSVITNTGIDSTIVNIALTDSGRFVAWDNTKQVFSQTRIEDYVMNVNNYGVVNSETDRGVKWSSYAVFLIDRDGYVMKVKGQSPNDSKWDNSRRYSSLRDFKTSNGIK